MLELELLLLANMLWILCWPFISDLFMGLLPKPDCLTYKLVAVDNDLEASTEEVVRTKSLELVKLAPWLY